YIFRVSPTSGFEYRSRVAHTTNSREVLNPDYAIRRSLYIGDVIYTVSGLKTFAYRLGDLVSIGNVIF
ncbi:MAG: beta-propeller domain-containing protein, partial [Acidobacteriota bacterium]